MQSLEQIERGNNAVVLQQADRLLVSNAAVLVTYEGLHAMDAKGAANEMDALTEAEAFVKASVGRRAEVRTRQGVRAVH